MYLSGRSKWAGFYIPKGSKTILEYISKVGGHFGTDVI
nr:MAG TPA: hypothetical protein [Caudoviricetes sp.]